MTEQPAQPLPLEAPRYRLAYSGAFVEDKDGGYCIWYDVEKLLDRLKAAEARIAAADRCAELLKWAVEYQPDEDTEDWVDSACLEAQKKRESEEAVKAYYSLAPSPSEASSEAKQEGTQE
jgi:hypothetical protein